MVLERCSLAGALLQDAVVSRVELADCRLSGLTWAEGTLEDVAFRDCRLNLAGFRHLRMQHVRFEGCDLREGNFAAARGRDVRFERCDLSGATFSGARFEASDCAAARSTASAARRGCAAPRFAVAGHRRPRRRAGQDGRGARHRGARGRLGIHAQEMAAFTKLNLRQDVEDMAPEFDLEGVESHFARVPLALEQSGVSYFKLAPGFRFPFGHEHGEQEEIYVLISGTATLALDDEELSAGAARRRADPGGDEAQRRGGPGGRRADKAFGAPNTENKDAEMIPGWWGED